MDLLNIIAENPFTVEESFKRIAKTLITNKALKVNNRLFAFIDLEFYYWHTVHQDSYCKNVNHNRPTGELELHRYGVDISLGNDQQNGFGGILIRGLFDTKDGVISKSQVVKEIYNQIKIGYNEVGIVDYTPIWNSIFATTRKNLGENSEFKDSKYRFLARDKEIFRKYEGKEDIFRNADLEEEEKSNLLGYKLK